MRRKTLLGATIVAGAVAAAPLGWLVFHELTRYRPATKYVDYDTDGDPVLDCLRTAISTYESVFGQLREPGLTIISRVDPTYKVDNPAEGYYVGVGILTCNDKDYRFAVRFVIGHEENLLGNDRYVLKQISDHPWPNDAPKFVLTADQMNAETVRKTLIDIAIERESYCK